MKPQIELKVKGKTKNNPPFHNPQWVPDGKMITGYYRYNRDDKVHVITDMDGMAHIVDPETVKLVTRKKKSNEA